MRQAAAATTGWRVRTETGPAGTRLMSSGLRMRDSSWSSGTPSTVERWPRPSDMP